MRMHLTQPPALPIADVSQSAASAAKNQRLTKAAHQFEAMLLGEMLKPLGKTDDEAMNGESSGSNPMQSFGVEAIAGSLANSGALGFAKQIEAALAAHAGGSSDDPAGTQAEAQTD